MEIGAGRYDFASTGFDLAQAMAGVRHVAGRLDVGCSLRKLLADERARAILVKYAGEGMIGSPQIHWVIDQPLDGLARFAPHLLTPERLQALQQELVTL